MIRRDCFNVRNEGSRATVIRKNIERTDLPQINAEGNFRIPVIWKEY